MEPLGEELRIATKHREDAALAAVLATAEDLVSKIHDVGQTDPTSAFQANHLLQSAVNDIASGVQQVRAFVINQRRRS